MPYDPEIHHRRSIRLKGYDYASPGWYYLTICTYERRFLFGEIIRDQMRPSEIGSIAHECWCEIPKHFPHAALDVSVVMPNHLHGIIIIGGESAIRTGTTRRARGACHGMPVQGSDGMAMPSCPGRRAAFGQPVPGSLATMVGQFKQAVVRRVQAGHDPAATVESDASYGHDTACPKGTPWHARTVAQGALAHIWHKNYYEHIIRSEKELNRIREYICTNPLRWRYDVENPASGREAVDDIEELLEAGDDEL
jgi:REP element-mobilizing transposase RayT